MGLMQGLECLDNLVAGSAPYLVLHTGSILYRKHFDGTLKISSIHHSLLMPQAFNASLVKFESQLSNRAKVWLPPILLRRPLVARFLRFCTGFYSQIRRSR